MTHVLAIAGETWAVRLRWTARGRGNRRGRAHVDTPDQTGVATSRGAAPAGAISLAAAIRHHIAAGELNDRRSSARPSWIAAVQADDGRIALIRCDAGRFATDAEQVLVSPARARALLEAAPAGHPVLASPSLDIAGAAALDPAAFAIRADMRLAPPAGRARPSAVMRAMAAMVLAMAFAAGVWWQDDVAGIATTAGRAMDEVLGPIARQAVARAAEVLEMFTEPDLVGGGAAGP